MDLTDRQLNILKSIVKDYIETAEAVGSRTISKKYDLGISAATIRNEMSDLEDMGYLEQPHTSAGRIPTQKGYKLYVASLMSDNDLEEHEKEMLDKFIFSNLDKGDDFIFKLSKVLSMMTNYTTVAVYDRGIESKTIKYIQLVSLSEHKVLLIVVTDDGDIKSKELSVNFEVPQAKLNLISDSISNKLSGRKINDLDETILSLIKCEIGEYSGLVDDLLYLLNSAVDSNLHNINISTTGATNILNYPEFNDMVKARAFLNMLEEKDNIAKIIDVKGIQRDNVNIVIGQEKDDLKTGLSIVTATYDLTDTVHGKISFIGPTRMDYSKLYSILNYMSLLLDKK